MSVDYSEIRHNPKLVSAWPEEVRYRLFTAYEYAYHTGVRPRGSAPFETDPRLQSATSSGDARSDLNVGPGVDPSASLGARLWYAGSPDLHDVYHEPEQTSEFDVDAPVVTMGVLKFDPDSDRQAEATEFGRRFTRTARFTIPVWHHTLNDQRAPEGGDLLEFWGDSWQDFGVFYEVTEVWEDGRVQSSPYFVQWAMEIDRNDEFVPERRLLGE